MAQRDGNASAAAYEQLRSHVLTGATADNPVGWVSLVRQGMAAWMARSSRALTSISVATDRGGLGVPWQLPDEVHGDIVRVLASMGLARIEGR